MSGNRNRRIRGKIAGFAVMLRGGHLVLFSAIPRHSLAASARNPSHPSVKWDLSP